MNGEGLHNGKSLNLPFLQILGGGCNPTQQENAPTLRTIALNGWQVCTVKLLNSKVFWEVVGWCVVLTVLWSISGIDLFK